MATLKSTKVYKFKYDEEDDGNGGKVQSSFSVSTQQSSLWDAYRPVHKRHDGDMDELSPYVRERLYDGDEEEGYKLADYVFNEDTSEFEELHDGTVITNTIEEPLSGEDLGIDLDNYTVSVKGKDYKVRAVRRTKDEYIVFGANKDDGAFNLRHIVKQSILLIPIDDQGRAIDDEGNPVDDNSQFRASRLFKAEDEVIMPHLRLYHTYKADSKNDLKELAIDDDWYIQDDNLTNLVNYEEEKLHNTSNNGQIPDPVERQWLIHDPNNQDMLYLNPAKLGILSVKESKEMYKVVRTKVGERKTGQNMTEPIYSYKVYRKYDDERENFIKQRIRMNNQRMHGVYDSEG